MGRDSVLQTAASVSGDAAQQTRLIRAAAKRMYNDAVPGLHVC
jgi:hypothetical protein